MIKSVFIVILTLIIVFGLYAETTFDGNIDIADGNYDLEFKLYSSNTSEYHIWSEIHNDVNVNDSSYSVILGSVNPLISIEPETIYFLEVYIDGTLSGERREIFLTSEITEFAREMEIPDSSSGVILEELTPSLELGNGTDDVIVVVGSDFGIGLAAGDDATGRLEVRGDEVRVWDGSAAVIYANGEGDLYVEDQLEVDNTIYVSHYRDYIGDELLSSGRDIEVTEDSDGSWTISTNSSRTWTFDSGLEGWTVSNPCSYESIWSLVTDNGRHVVKANYNVSISSSMLLSPVVSIDGGTVNLEYTHRWSTESCCDEAFIQYRLDGGAWQHFTPTTGSYNGDHACDLDPTNGCTSRNQTAYYGIGGYETHSGDISTGTASTIQIALVITSDVAVQSTGWWIDEVTLIIGDGESMDDKDWTGAGTGTMTTENLSDRVGIGTSSVTGMLDVRGDEVRIWDGDASCEYASGAGDLFVEDVLEVDNLIYVPKIYDADDTVFNLDPALTSSLNIIDNRSYIYHSGSSYGGGVAIADCLVPTVSNTYDLGTISDDWGFVYANKFYDGDDTTYCLDPTGTSTLNISDHRRYINASGSSYGGNLGINDNLVPVGETYDLGYGTATDWDDLWISKKIYIDGYAGTPGQVLKTDGGGNVYWGEDRKAGCWCNGDITFENWHTFSTYLFPLNIRYNYTRSASLLLWSELPPNCVGGKITAVSIFVNTPTTGTFSNFSIFMKDTTTNSFISGTAPWSMGTEVYYTPSIEFDTSGWHTFTLDPQFNWLENNLQISFQHGYSTSSSPFTYFRISDTSPEYLQISGSRDYSWPYNYTHYRERTSIRLTFAGSGVFREREVELSTPHIDVSSMDLDCGYIELLDDEVRVSYSEPFSEALGCRTPVILTSVLEPGKNIIVSDVDQTGFTAHCDDPEGAKFNWGAMIKPVTDDEALYRIENSEEYRELRIRLQENPSAHTYEEWNRLFQALGVECAPIRKDEYNRRVVSSTEDTTGEE